MKADRGAARGRPSTPHSAVEMNLETSGNLGRTATIFLRTQTLKWSGITTIDLHTLKYLGQNFNNSKARLESKCGQE